MRWATAARVSLALCGWGLVFGVVAEVPESLGLLRLAVFPVLVTLPFAALRVHRTVHRAVAREGSSA